MRLTKWHRVVLAAAACIIGLLTSSGMDSGEIQGTGWLFPVVVSTALFLVALTPVLPAALSKAPVPALIADRLKPPPAAIERLITAYNKLRRALIAQFDTPELDIPLPPLEMEVESDDGAAAVGDLIFVNTTMAWAGVRTSKLQSVGDFPKKPPREALIALGRANKARSRLNEISRCLQEYLRLDQEATVAECAYSLLVTPMSADGRGVLRQELKRSGDAFRSYVEGVLCDIIHRQNEQLRTVLALDGNPELPADAGDSARSRVAAISRQAAGPYNERALVLTIARMANLTRDPEPLSKRLLRAHLEFVSDQSGFARPSK